MGTINRALATVVALLPRPLVHLVARRYVAGSTLADALEAVARLNAEGASATVDILGENTERLEQCHATREAYLELLRALAARGADSNVSIKLTALGLKLDPALCLRNVEAICAEAARLGRFVRIDMEDSSCTQATLDLYEEVRKRHANVGPVLQAYLRRTLGDARRLAASRADVRLCKGIYDEPHEIAWKERDIVQRSYVASLRGLLTGGSHVGIATHDELLVFEALALVEELGIGRDGYEFQMLLGVQEPLRRILVAGGHRLRVYVPFGEHWYEYSLRRLKENPEIAGHVARATVSRLLAAVTAPSVPSRAG